MELGIPKLLPGLMEGSEEKHTVVCINTPVFVLVTYPQTSPKPLVNRSMPRCSSFHISFY